MYSGPLLQSGNLGDYTALGEVGYPVFTAAPQIRLAISRQIGQDVADFLAIPKHHPDGKSIDWYAPVDGDIVPWSAASAEERAQLTAQIQTFRARIAEHASKIRASAAAGDQRVFGLLLEQSTRIPDENHLFLVGHKPVITFWGFLRAGEERGRDVLGELRGAPPEAGIARLPDPVGRSSWRWLPLALIPLLLLLLLWAGLQFWHPFGLTVPAFPIALGPQPEDQEFGQLHSGDVGPDGVVIHDGTIVNGGTAVDGTGTATTTVPIPAPSSADGTNGPTAGSTAPDAASNENTPPDAGAQDQNSPGTNSENPPAPDSDTTNPANQANNPPQPPINPINIPNNATDPSFLAGEWRSDSGLRDKDGKAAMMSYKFDSHGNGTTTLSLSDGSTCQGASTATVDQGRVIIKDQDILRCSNGGAFRGATTTCEKDPSSGKTRCRGTYGPDQGNFDVMLGR